MNDLTRGERLQIMLTAEELEALDSWRFSRRMPSRAAAVRELLKRGLAAEGFGLAEGGSKSQDFGVTGASSSNLSNAAMMRVANSSNQLRAACLRVSISVMRCSSFGFPGEESAGAGLLGCLDWRTS